MKAPVYQEKDAVCSVELLKQLHDTVVELEFRMRATIPIHKGSADVGFGVSKVQKGIAADAVISVVRAIKSIKSW